MAKFISVPRNVEAMYDDEYGQWNSDEHYVWYLNDEDISQLWEAFNLMNKMFEIIIDTYEAEEIFYQKLFFNREELFDKFNCFPCKEQVNKLKEMIDKAIETKTLLSFHLQFHTV